MKIQAQDLRDLICGTLKIIEPTDKRDSSKRVIWKAECICGKFEYGARPEFEKVAGHSDCPGHPFKGKAKPVAGFRLHPDMKGTVEQAEAAAAWELRRHPEQLKEKKDRPLSTDENKILRERLGLSGYKTETVKLNPSVAVLGCQAEKVVFAAQIDGTDRVLLHVALVGVDGKRSIVSSKKKVPENEWKSVADALIAMEISWRDREPKRVSK